jgi:hypothetical protein
LQPKEKEYLDLCYGQGAEHFEHGRIGREALVTVLWRSEEHEALGERSWDEGTARAVVSAIVADADAAAVDGVWPGHPDDDEWEGFDSSSSSLYLGSAGMIWALRRLGSSLDLPSLAAGALERYRSGPDFRQDAASLWMGETGLLVVAAKVGSAAADMQRLRQLIRQNRNHPAWELMYGSPGTILAARACGLKDELAESSELLWQRWDPDTDLWTQEVFGYTAQFLGPPHGLAGNVHALRGYVPDADLRERVARALERTVLREDDLANWPPSRLPIEGWDSRIRVQWCFGAPGMVATLADLMPPELALAGGELIWRAGPLRKGAGLCHGTAGNGYAFLKLFTLTGDQRWLDRARRFAVHAARQVEAERTHLGRGHYTLWTGDVGVALYLQACISADAAVPTIDVW